MSNIMQKAIATATIATTLTTPVWATTPTTQINQPNNTTTPITQSATATGKVACDPLNATIKELQVKTHLSNGLYITNGGNIAFSSYQDVYKALKQMIADGSFDMLKTEFDKEGVFKTYEEMYANIKTYDEILALYKEAEFTIPEGCIPSPLWNGKPSLLFTATSTASKADWSFLPNNVKDAYLEDALTDVLKNYVYYPKNIFTSCEKIQKELTEKYLDLDNVEVMEFTVSSLDEIPKNIYSPVQQGLECGVRDLTFSLAQKKTLSDGTVIGGGLKTLGTRSFQITVNNKGISQSTIGVADKNGKQLDITGANPKYFSDLNTITEVVFGYYSEGEYINTDSGYAYVHLPKIIICHIR